MKSALLLIDLQREFLNRPGLEPSSAVTVAGAATLLHAWRGRGLPVIHVWMTVDRNGNSPRLPHWRESERTLVAGSAEHATPESLRPVDGEPVIHKAGFNPFATGALEKALREAGCDTVVLAGTHLHACVRATAMECLERGLTVFVAQDATASDDPAHAAATRRWLSRRCVRFEPTHTLLQLVDGGGGAVRELHRSPRRLDEVLFEVHSAGPDEVHQAASEAHEAWSRWSATPLADRLSVLNTLASRLESATGDLAHAMAVNIGKPIRQGEEEIARVVLNIRDVARRAAIFESARREGAGWIRSRPVGVVGVISTWNNPVAIPLGKIAPALAYGNTVVWKPAPAATRIAEIVTRLLDESGVPPDVVRMLPGNHVTALAIAEEEHVRALTLTGSASAGRALQEICSRRWIRFQAELSGNNAAIVWDDADLPEAASQVAWGAFAFAGQRCTANRRVIVAENLFDKFLDLLGAATTRLAWGDPFANETEIGPVISAAKRDEIRVLVETADADGALHRVVRPHAARSRAAWTAEGAYAEPVIVACDEPGHAVVQEETMGPLLVVQRARDFDHAIELCNGVRHGLVAALFSNTPALRQRFLNDAQAGNLKFNTSTAGVDVTLPFAGWRASGVGPPEHGEADVQFYTQLQSVYGIEGDSIEAPDQRPA